jgi:hypothetical protein
MNGLAGQALDTHVHLFGDAGAGCRFPRRPQEGSPSSICSPRCSTVRI